MFTILVQMLLFFFFFFFSFKYTVFLQGATNALGWARDEDVCDQLIAEKNICSNGSCNKPDCTVAVN